MKSGLILLLFTISAFAQELLTPQQAIEIGLKKNYQIQIARNNAQIAGNNSALGTAGFLPGVDISGSKSYSESEETTNSPFSFGNSDTDQLTGQVALSWTLFDGFAMFANYRRFNALEKAGIAQSRQAIENSVLSILGAYFNLVQQQKLYNITKDNLEISQQRLEKIELQKDIGGASSTDYLQAKVAYNNDLAEVINSELLFETASSRLNTLLAVEPETRFTVIDSIIIPENSRSLDDWQQLVSENNSTLISNRQLLVAAEKNITNSTARFLPRLSLSGSYSYTDRTVESQSRGEITTENENKLIGLNLSFNLFNGMRDNIARQNAKLEARNQLLLLQQTELEIKALLNEKFLNYNNRIKLLNLEQENVRAAKQSFDLQSERYALGATTSLDFRDAQVNLNRARVNFIAAQYQARIALLELEQLAGVIQID